MKLTAHAVRRWRERFPDLDPEKEWRDSRRVGGGKKGQLKKQCPAHAHDIRKFRGKYYTISPRNVVFVVVPGEIIITVFPLGEKDKESKAA